MRRATFILVLAYALFFAWMWFDTGSSSLDAAGRGMARGFLLVGMAVTALFALPALALAALDRAPRMALILAMTPAAGAVVLTLGNAF